VRKQKTDRQDAQLILRLMLKDDFPKIWMHNWENREGVRPALDYRGNRERGDPSLLSRHHWAITERADQR
jgi:hypothetical protein